MNLPNINQFSFRRHWHYYLAAMIFFVCGIAYGEWLFGIPLLFALVELVKYSKVR
jgi:hypothetical protein